MAPPPSFNQFSTAPIYNTKAVARDTTVPPDTFRAWERRYGIPRPQRTAGGHRLYSERDIAIIRWLRDRTAEGVNISHAVMLLNNVLGDEPQLPSEAESRALDRMTDELTTALTSFDSLRGERIVSEAFALYPFEQVLLELIQPTMVEVGERWHRGEINIAAEHFTTEFIRRKLAGLLNVFDNSSQRETIIVGCAPKEQHDLGVMFISLFLMRRGWHVVYLGPQMPLADLIRTVETVKADMVCLSASTAETATLMLEVAEALQERFPNVRFGYGGRIFNINPELTDRMPGTFLGSDGRAIVDTVAAVLSRNVTSSYGD